MPKNESSLSRRQIVGSAGLSLAAIASTAPASAQGLTDVVSPKPLEDPTKKYPRPPYNRQSQPWPGLASKMDPAPDHGEKSYRGTVDLLAAMRLLLAATPGWAPLPRSHMRARERMSPSIISRLKRRSPVRSSRSSIRRRKPSRPALSPCWNSALDRSLDSLRRRRWPALRFCLSSPNSGRTVHEMFEVQTPF